MFVATHFAVPFFVALAWTRRDQPRLRPLPRLVTATLCGLFGVLPDCLNVHSRLDERMNSTTHAVWPVLVLLALMPLLGLCLRRLPRVLVWGVPFAWLSHLALDAISGGIRPLYPRLGPVGAFYIHPEWWVPIDCVMLFALYLAYRQLILAMREPNGIPAPAPA